MLKKYVKYQIKKWMPLLAVGVLFMGFIYWLTMAVIPTSVIDTRDGTAPHTMSSSGFLALAIPALIVATVLPLFIFHYRTSKKAVDTYYQAAFRPRDFKRARFLIGMGMLAIAVTAVFLVGFALFALRYATTPESYTGPYNYTNYRVEYHFAYVPLLFLLVLLAVLAQYSISSFLVSLGDYIFDQLCLLYFGNVFLGLIVVAPYFLIYVHMSAAMKTFAPTYEPFLYGFSPIGGMILPIQIDSALICNYYASRSTASFIGWPTAIATYLMFVAFAGGVLVYNLLSKDPSGEYASLRGARNKPIALLPHGVALLVGIIVSAATFLSVRAVRTQEATFSSLVFVGLFFGYLMFGLMYFLVVALWRLRIKPTKFDLICYLSVYGFTLLLMIINGILGLAR